MSEIKNFIENTKYEIKTPYGWCDFDGISLGIESSLVEIEDTEGNKIESSLSHTFFSNGKKMPAVSFSENQHIDSITGTSTVKNIKFLEKENEQVFDIVGVKNKDHSFYANKHFITKNCDELAFVPPNIQEAFWTSASSTLSTGGSAIITSTPLSTEDLFGTIWSEANERFDEKGIELSTPQGKNGFVPLLAIWSDVPERDEEWRKMMLGKMSLSLFKQEHECVFISSAATLIDSVKLQDYPVKEPLLVDKFSMRWFTKVEPKIDHCVVLDPSMGTGGDNAAIQVYNLQTMEQVAEWKDNMTSTRDQLTMVKAVLNQLLKINGGNDDHIYWSFENNSLGEAIAALTEVTGIENFPGRLLKEPRKKGQGRGSRRQGLNTNKTSKAAALDKMKFLIENDLMKINSKPLLLELRQFISKKNGTFSAAPGYKDDLVMSSMLAVRVFQIVSKQNPDSYEHVAEKVKIDDDEDDPFMGFFAL